MSVVKVNFPGVLPVILQRAAEKNITEEAAWAEREREAEDRLAEAAELLDRIRPFVAEGAPRG